LPTRATVESKIEIRPIDVLVSTHDFLRNGIRVVSDAQRFRIGPWTATPALNLLERDSRPVRIEPRAMDVLVYLARRNGAVASVDELLAAVWKGRVVGDGSVYLAIRQLRQALGDGADGARFIETIPKRGYRLTVPVEHVRRIVRDDAARRMRVPLGAAVAGAAILAAILGAIGVTLVHDGARSSSFRSVAVRPFVTLSSDSAQRDLADGVTAEVLSALASIHDLRVIETEPESRAGGAALDVEQVLEGSVRTAGDQVRITAQLADARTGARLWSETYEGRLDARFSIEDDVAASVADALQVKLGVGAVGRTPGMTGDVAAYAEYRRAMQLNLEWQPESFPRAISHLQRAVALDPSFSLAWGGLNTVYSNGALVVPARAEEWRPRGSHALEEARALTPDAPHVLLESGIAALRSGRWLDAAALYQRLDDSYARHGLADRAWGPRGVFLLAVGRVREAVPALERARAQEPLAAAFAGFLSQANLAAGDPAAALAEADRGLALEGLDANLRRASFSAALTLGEPAEIDARLRAMLEADAGVEMERELLALPDASAAATIAARAEGASAAAQVSLARWAAFYGEPGLALELLADAVPHLSQPAVLWEPLLRDARRRDGFKKLVENLGLVEYWRVHGWSDFCRPTEGTDFECR
jgi:DNA-binding winged helix-turn-helix (wHTH) protein/TolB-like protein/tetratricopeptide (TPR) repeat protein